MENSACHTSPSPQLILAVNGGSSSIKFAMFEAAVELRRTFSGGIDRIGLSGGTLKTKDATTNQTEQAPLATSGHAEAVERLVEWLAPRTDLSALAAIGHRIVHGGPTLLEPRWIDDGVLMELRRLAPFDPEHLPGELDLIEGFRRATPHARQAACFDTSFHRNLPDVARMLAIPRQYAAQGVRRYGFHGLSYSYLVEELSRLDPAAATGRVVLAHLGNGASMAAVAGGKCVDTSMAFTPTAGLVMSTRSGDFDPGLVRYFIEEKGMSALEFHDLVNRRSGLLGVSETSSDMRDLLARREDDSRAAEAVALFCYQAKKTIGAYAAALGGLDAIVFSGGIGENAHEVRAMICDGLEYLEVVVDASRNSAGESLISTAASRTRVFVIRTDEERVIARTLRDLLAAGVTSKV